MTLKSVNTICFEILQLCLWGLMKPITETPHWKWPQLNKSLVWCMVLWVGLGFAEFRAVELHVSLYVYTATSKSRSCGIFLKAISGGDLVERVVKVIWITFPHHFPHHWHCKGPQENQGKLITHDSTCSVAYRKHRCVDDATAYYIHTIHKHLKLTDEYRSMQPSCHVMKLTVDTFLLLLLSSSLLHNGCAVQQFVDCFDTPSLELNVSGVETVEEYKHLGTTRGSKRSTNKGCSNSV